MKKSLPFVIAVILVVAGVALLAGLALANQEASQSGRWTQAIATIEKSDVRTGAVDLSYRYEIAGREHRNPAGTLGIRDGSDRAALLERYAAGHRVLIYVSAANPAESVLELPPHPPSWPLFAGVFLLILGAALAIFFWRQRALRSRTKPIRKRPTRPMSRLRPPPSIKRT